MDLIEEDYFTALNEDCILEIFERLPLDELCAISRTCKKLQRLAEYQFNRSYSNLKAKRIIIHEQNGVIGFKEKDKYVKCFGQYIENFAIAVWQKEMGAKLLQFMRSNCCKTIKNMDIYYDGYTGEFATGIKEFLQSTETISFQLVNYRESTIIPLNLILNHLPRLKTLKICNSARGMKLPAITCPSLDTFQYNGSCPSLEDLKDFFMANPTIKRFVWRFCVIDLPLIKSLFKMIAESEIEELFVDWRAYCYARFSGEITLEQEIKLLNERTTFKRLELFSICGPHLSRFVDLVPLKAFKGFHLHSNGSSYSNPYISQFSSFVNLTVLSIDGNISKRLAVDLSKHLKDLKEVHLFPIKEYPIESIIVPFIRNSPKLMGIFIPFRNNLALDFSKLNTERTELKNATELVIYLGRTNRILQNQLVSVQPIHMIKGDPRLSNPLLSLY